jgi:hypothetical protein
VVVQVTDCASRHDEIASRIAGALPAVRERSMTNFRVIHGAVAG